MKHRSSIAMLFLISFIWGSSYLFVQEAIDRNLGVSFIMAGRFLLAALFIYLAARGKIQAGSNIKSGIIGGLIVFLGFFTQNTGQKSANISSVALFTATNVVMLPLLRWALYGKKPNYKTLVCCVLSFLGVSIMSYRMGEIISLSFGEMLVLLAAFFFALHMVYLDSKVKMTDTNSLIFWQMLFAGLYGTVLTLFLGEMPRIQSLLGGLLPVLYVGLLATGLCYYLQVKAQRHVSAALTGMVLSLECIFGAAFSVALGYEPFSVRVLFGALLIVSSLAIMELLPNNSIEKILRKKSPEGP